MAKSPKPKKADLIQDLQDRLTEEHWELIHQLMGREIKPASRANFLSGLFHKTIKVSSRKGKGRQLQQWMCRQIGKLTGCRVGKDEDIASREMGQSGCDVRLSQRVRDIFPFSVECKSGESWDLPRAIKQAKDNCYPGTNWLVCLDRPHRQPDKRVKPIIVLSSELFFKLLAIIKKEGK